MSRQFCHHCGNKTLRKVSVSINSDGSMQYYMSKRKNFSTRGLRVKFILVSG